MANGNGNGNDTGSTMEELFSGLGGADLLGEMAFTPAQRFRQFAQQRTAPGGLTRNALYAMQSPLLQQYYLGGMGGTPRFGTGGQFGGSFADFMGGYTGAYPTGAGTNLRGLAGQIGQISQMPETGTGSFVDYLRDIQGTDPVTAQQAAIWRDIYGSGEDAAQNRLGLANLIALQRPGGGIYGGVIGRALGSVLNELHQQYTMDNPLGNFLNYFLTQTGAEGSDFNMPLSQLYGMTN